MKLINALLLVAFLSTTAIAQQPIEREVPVRNMDGLIEQNITANLKSGSLGIQASTIQLVIQLSENDPTLDLDYTVIPMMDILKTNEHPELRILAALGLYHLDSELGKFAVSRRVKYEDSDRVAKICRKITSAWNVAEDTTTNGFAARDSKEL